MKRVFAHDHPSKRQRQSSQGVGRSLVTSFHSQGRLDMHEFDDAVIEDLDSLGQEGATRALTCFCDADRSTVRNPSGFLKGIINKVRTPFAPARASTSSQSGAHSGESYQALLWRHHKEGTLDMNILDTRIMSDLDALPPALAMKAVDTYAAADRTNVRNPCGFLKGIINALVKSSTPVAGGPSTQYASDRGAADIVPLPPLVQRHLDTAIEKRCIDAHQVDSGLLVALSELKTNDAIRVLGDFMLLDPSMVHNKPGMLVSMIRRLEQRERGDEGEPSRGSPGPSILDTMQEYHNQGRLDMTDFDSAILRDLEALPPHHAHQAVESFLAVDQSTIRNRCGFLKGIINALRHGDAPSAEPPVLHQEVRERVDEAIGRGCISLEECDGALMAELAGFEPEVALDVLTEVMEADPCDIHDKAGFLRGIMRRKRQELDQTHPGQPSTESSVQELLDHYGATGEIDVSQLDDGIVGSLASLPPGGAAKALKLLSVTDQSSINNLPGFLKGIINKLRQDGMFSSGSGDNRVSRSSHTIPVAPPPPPSAYAQRPAPPRYTAAPPPPPPSTSRPFPTAAHVSAANVRPQTSAPPVPPPSHDSFVFCPSCGLRQPRLNFCSKCGFALRDHLDSLGI